MERRVKNTIILIDDNKDILWMWQMFLERLQYDVKIMETGRQFRDYLETNRELEGVICILCDENLSHEKGSDLYKMLMQHRINKMVPFVIISGLAEVEVLERIEDTSYLKVLKKPISLDHLKTIVHQLQLQASSHE